MNYIDSIAADIMYYADGSDKWDRCPNYDRELYRIYAVLALTVGEDVTLENVHDAWSAWRSGTKADHKSIIPFSNLDEVVQELDRPYANAIKRAATSGRN